MENVFVSRPHYPGPYDTYSRNLDDTRCNFNHTSNCTNNNNNTPIYINTATNGVIYNSNSSSNKNSCIYNYNITRSNDNNNNTSHNYTINRSNNDNYNAANNTDINSYTINTDNDYSNHSATNNHYKCASNNTTYHRRANNVQVNDTITAAYNDDFQR